MGESGTYTTRTKAALFTVIVTVVSLLLALLAGEAVLRIKNSDGKNYHIEMWKYSRTLKQRSGNPVLGHEHIPGKEAELQNVMIRINSNGMRGEEFQEIKPGQRRIMFLGSSATLGWGVEEEKTLSSLIESYFKKDGRDVVIMNAGIGNYNARRYVELFLSKNTKLKPTDIVVNYYLNDAEILEAGGGNIFLRHSQLAVTFWILLNRLKAQNKAANLFDHYKHIYQSDYQGFQDMQDSLERLAVYARKNNVRLYLMMMPEVHDLQNYKYAFAHEIVRDIALKNGYIYIDPLDEMQKIEDTKSLWAMPGDPHPNAMAHKVFADALYPALKR